MASWYRHLQNSISPLYLSVCTQIWFTASIIPYLCAAPCSVFRANPQPERESDIDAPADRLPTPVQLIDVYLAHVHKGPRLSIA